MCVNYRKLWKLLIDKNMKKQTLAKEAGVSASTIAKLGRNENVNIDVLAKICIALACGLDDIVEINAVSECEAHDG